MLQRARKYVIPAQKHWYHHMYGKRVKSWMHRSAMLPPFVFRLFRAHALAWLISKDEK